MSTYKDVILHGCAITRFTDETYRENIEWRRKHNYEHGCIYNCTTSTPHSMRGIPIIFVIEMNITTKKVIGVGMITNKEYYKKKLHVYNDNQYNYHSYISKYRMEMDDFNDQEKEIITRILEKCLFTGYCHLIRGIGFSQLPHPLVHKTGRGTKRVETRYDENFTLLFKRAFKRHFNIS